MRSLYDLAFAYREGDRGRPDVAAGVFVENLSRIMFEHRGTFMARLRGGMGDVVFAPLDDLLRDRRGVEIEASEPFGRMLDALPTVATQSLQLWRTEPPPERADAIVGGHDAPFDTACDMTHVEEEETWEHGCVRHISYHCGVLEGRERAPQDGPSLDPAELSAATASVRESAERFVGQAKPPGLSADTLADGQGRPGGTLDAVNAGSVEAAVMSGREAAAALAAAQGLELQPLHAKDIP